MTTARVIAAGCSAVVTIIGVAVWFLAVGPIFNGMFPIIMENTPSYWFKFLHGDMIMWIIPMVYVLGVLASAIASAMVVLSAFKVQDYETF